MFNNDSSKRFANWFPGKTDTVDRWGETLGGDIHSAEFKGAKSASTGAAERMRWSLGHA